MKFRNFLASVMADCARGHAGGRSLIPSPRLGVPMETGSKPISGLLSCLSHLVLFYELNMLLLAWANPASAGSWAAEGSTSWSEWVAAVFHKSRGERDSPPQDVRRNRYLLKDFSAETRKTMIFIAKFAVFIHLMRNRYGKRREKCTEKSLLPQ